MQFKLIKGNFQDSMADTVQNMDSWSTSKVTYCLESPSSWYAQSMFRESNHVQPYTRASNDWVLHPQTLTPGCLKCFSTHCKSRCWIIHITRCHTVKQRLTAPIDITDWNGLLRPLMPSISSRQKRPQNHPPPVPSRKRERASFIPCHHTLLNRLMINLWHWLVNDLRDKWQVACRVEVLMISAFSESRLLNPSTLRRYAFSWAVCLADEQHIAAVSVLPNPTWRWRIEPQITAIHIAIRQIHVFCCDLDAKCAKKIWEQRSNQGRLQKHHRKHRRHRSFIE